MVLGMGKYVKMRGQRGRKRGRGGYKRIEVTGTGRMSKHVRRARRALREKSIVIGSSG